MALAEELAPRLERPRRCPPRSSTGTSTDEPVRTRRRRPRWWPSAAGTGSAATLRAGAALRRPAHRPSCRWPTTGVAAAACASCSTSSPLGDLRKCLVALADRGLRCWPSAFEHRFDEGELAGHALGNLILAGLIDATGDPVAAPRRGVPAARGPGRVLPATTEPVVLKAEADGGTVAGQVAVKATDNIRRVSLVPGRPPSPRPWRSSALEQADQIVIGPGIPVHQRAGRRGRARGSAEAVGRSREHQGLRLQPAPRDPRDRAASTWPDHVDALAAHGVDGGRGRSVTPSGYGARDDRRRGGRRAPGPGQRPGPRPGQTGAGAARSLLAMSVTPSVGQRRRAVRTAGTTDSEERGTSNDGTGRHQRLRAHRAELPPGRAGHGGRRGGGGGQRPHSAETLAHLLRYDSTHGRLSAAGRGRRASTIVVGDRTHRRPGRARPEGAALGRARRRRGRRVDRAASPPGRRPRPTSRPVPSGSSSRPRRPTPTPPS